MNYTPDQFIETNQANLHVLKGLSTKIFSNYAKLLELNLAATKAMFAESFHHTRDLLDVKTPQDFFNLQGMLAKPMVEKSATYGWAVYEITADTGAKFAQVAEDQLTQIQLEFSYLVNSLLKNAPHGVEPAMAMFKNAITAGQHAIGAAQSSAKKAVKVAESNMTEMTHHVLNASTLNGS